MKTTKALLGIFTITLGLAVQVQAQFLYTVTNGTITITGYTGPGGAVSIPSTISSLWVTSIGDWAFSGCGSLTSITFPTSVTNIGVWAFVNCSRLTSVTMPNSIISIGFGAFSTCGLTSITIPSSVTSIGDYPFSACSSLTAITVDPLNPSYSSPDGVLFDKSMTTLIEFPGGKAGGYTVPNSVTRIGNGAFANCYGLTSVTIPEGVITIGDSAFYQCLGLTSVTIPNSVISLGEGAFNSCNNLTFISLGNSITNIGPITFFQCNRLMSITLPATVTSIGQDAFGYCSRMKGIYFQGNAPRLGPDAFEYNGATVYYLTGTTGWGTTYGGLQTYPWDPSVPTTLGYAIVNGSVTITGYWGVDSAVTIPSTILGLPVRNIGDFALWFSDSLTSITIPDSVTYIGLAAFSECSSLYHVIIGSGVTTIGGNAFSDCSNLSGVYFSGNAPSLDGSSVFYGDDNATVYYLPGTTGWGPTFGGRPTALWPPPTNRPPVIGNPFIKVIGDEVWEIPAYRFLIWCSDPDNDPLSLTAVTSPSAMGAVVTLETNRVSYAPPLGFLGDDTFGYTITDGKGGFASGTASVLVEPRRLAAATMLPPITSIGPIQVNFTGFADLGYTVERAESLDGPWTTIGNVLADDNGVASFTDRNPPAGNAFYRAVHY